MRSISQFRGIHAGKRIVLTATGPSLLDHDLSRVNGYVVAICEAWKFLRSDALVYFDSPQHDWFLEGWPSIEAEKGWPKPLLFTGTGRTYGDVHLTALNTYSPANIPRLDFSFDLNEGVYLRSTPYLAMQLAAWMLQREPRDGSGWGPPRGEIVFLGLDLKERETGEVILGHAGSERAFNKRAEAVQREVLTYGYALLKERGVRVWNCSLASELTSIPRVKFEDVFAKELYFG